MHQQQTRQEYLETFRAEVRTYAVKGPSHLGSIIIALRHSVHPHGYDMAFDLMRICAEETGDTLTADGVWERGALGELWLPKALQVRQQALSSRP